MVENPTLIPFFKNKMVQDIECGGFHSVAIIREKYEIAYAWGSGMNGELGNG